MSLAEYIDGALRAMGKRRQDLAHTLNVSSSAITRLLARPDEAQTLGQLKAVADALGLRWHHALYDSEMQSQNTKTVANTISHKPGQNFIFESSFDIVYRLAAEHNLINLMRVEIEPKLYPLELKQGNEVEVLSVLGWHLGKTKERASPECNVDVYWYIYTSHSDWNQNFNGNQNNILLFNELGEASLHSINHTSSRVHIQQPSTAGRIYNSLESDIVMRSFGDRSHLIVENKGVSSSAHLIFTDVQTNIDLFTSMTTAIQNIERLADEYTKNIINRKMD
ncbi:hypothetical protein [Deinococcus aquaedulcis]|uniref:hypothetical protein n=1 Tax=Deinococcus aquaedulcis TaxID=2840455 RepID=UPI001C8332B3|nr:hypothetical protein [Deinococcus aquaedulcis]